MKNFIRALALVFVCSSALMAGSISGTIYYGGLTSGDITIAVFNDPLFVADPIAMSTIAAPGGAYIVDNAALVDGATYYVICILPTIDLDNVQEADPWAIYSTMDISNPTPLQLSAGALTGIEMTMVDGSNPFAAPIYDIEADLRYNASAGSSETSYSVSLNVFDINSPNATSVIVNGPAAVDMSLDYSDEGSERIWSNSLSTKAISWPTQPTLPLNYSFQVSDGAGAAIYNSTITTALTALPGNFSPAEGANLTTPPSAITWDWTGPALNYFFVTLFDRGSTGTGWAQVLESGDLSYALTPYSADCSAVTFTPGNYYSYVITARTSASNNARVSSSFRVDFAYDVPVGGSVEGAVSYTGSQTGSLYMSIGHGDPSNWLTDPSLVEFNGNFGAVTFPYAYSFTNIPQGTDYYVLAWIDSTADGAYDYSTEANAVYTNSPISVTAGATTSLIDLTLADPGSTTEGSYTYYDSGSGVPLSIESLSVRADGGGTTISPNGDGINDGFSITYVLVSTVPAITTSGGAQVLIVADTNGNGIADPFKWAQVMWGDDGYPHYIPAVAISTSSVYYNENGNDWWGYFNSLTDTEKEALKLTYQELDAKQANSDYDFWDWLSGSDFILQGDGSYKTNPRTIDINFAWDWLKRIPSNGDCEIFIEAAAPWYSPATLSVGDSSSTIITVTDVGVVKGTVTLPGGAPAAYAEVTAGNNSSWNRTFTDANGVYELKGMASGLYFMEARQAGYATARVQNVSVSGEETWQNFELGTGVRITATIQLPTPFQPYTDQWGNTVTQLWGNLSAWSMYGSDGGWSNFRISSGSASAVCVLPVVEGTYSMQAYADKYVSVSTTIVLSDGPGGVLASGATFYNMVINLEPAVDIRGYIVIESTNTMELQNQWISVNARSTDNTAWGWGQREWDQNQWEVYGSSTVMPFTVWNVTPNKSYILQFWSEYYAEASTTVAVGTTTVNIAKADAILLDEGENISGNLVINWSPKTYEIFLSQAWEDGGVKKIWVNLDAFDEISHQGKNIGFSVPISSDTQSVLPYTIAGLTSGSEYQMNVWGLDQGFEQENRWQKVAAGSTKTVTFNPFSGSITGLILDDSGNPVSSATISISCEMLWNKGTSNSDVTLNPEADGSFSIGELMTGEYVVTIAEKDGITGMFLGNYGVVQRRALVNNGAVSALGTINLRPAGEISGTLVLNSVRYPTWTDVYNASTQTYYIYDHRGILMEGSPMDLTVRAMSARQMQQGGDIRESALKANLEFWSPTVASYTIRGLSEGSYVIIPPLYFDPSNDGNELSAMFGGPSSANADLASITPMVPLVTGESKTIEPLTLVDGVAVRGTVQRSKTGVEGHYWVQLVSREHFVPAAPGKPINFVDYGTYFAGGTTLQSTLNSPSQSFSFASIYPGKYNAMVQVWDQSYKDVVMSFEIPAGSTRPIDLGTLMLQKGANITGTLRDEDTGAVIYDGVTVRCQSIPRGQGTHRQTRSYDDQWASADIKISSTTGNFKLMNLPAGTYEVEVESSKSELSYGYVFKRIVGITVPDSTADVALGTIELKKGRNISGIVRDANGPVPNVKVQAEPMFGTMDSRANYRTDSEGKFVLKGLNPEIIYWKLTAAPRPEVWDKYEDADYYAPTIRRNVMLGSTGTVLTVTLPTLGVSGVVMTPQLPSKNAMEILAPSMGGGDQVGLKSYGAFVVLQFDGEQSDDPFGGYQTISRAPFWVGENDGPGYWKSSFTVMGLSPGRYNMRVVVQDFCSEYIRGIAISTGSGVMALDPVILSTGSTLSGVFTKADGTKVTTAEVDMAAAATTDMTEIVMGELITNSSTGEIESYRIRGLRRNSSYIVVLPGSEKDSELFMAPETQRISQASQTYDFIYQDYPPTFVSWIKKSSNTITIEAFSSKALRNSQASNVLVLDGVYDINGSTLPGSFDSIELSANKTDIRAQFTFTGGANSIAYHFEGTDLKGNKQSPSTWTGSGDYPFAYTFYKAWDNYAQKNINPTFGGTVEVGNGDDSSVYLPTGSMDSSSDVRVTVGKTAFPSESVPAPSPSVSRSAAAMRVYAETRDSFYSARYGAAMPTFDGPALAVSTGSALYEIKARLVSGPLASIAANRTVELTFEYDSTISTHPATDLLYVYRSTASSGAEWNLVDSSPVIDTDNNTIKVQTNHFSYFGVFKLASAPSATIVNPAVSSLSPSSGEKGDTIASVTVTGTGFKDGIGVSFSPTGVSVSSITRVSSTQLKLWNVAIAGGAATGARTVTVTNADGGYGTLANAFTVNSSSLTVSISTVTVSGSANPGQTITLTITGSGLDKFADEAGDVVRLDNASASYQITGTTTSVSTGTLVVNFVIPTAAPAGSYDLRLYDNSGEYLMRSAVVTVVSNPYEDNFRTYAFPNPCRADSLSIKVSVPGTAADSAAGATVNGELRIYTVTGELVWSASQSLKKAVGPGDSDPSWAGENIINWDLKNSNGLRVSSGVYFYIVEVAGQGRDRGKIAVIR